MLARSLVEEIGRLLGDGKLSHRQIAARLGVSRGTISAIANGRRGLHGKEPQMDERKPPVRSSPPARCPRCGYRVYMPCLICRIRERPSASARASVAIGAEKREDGACDFNGPMDRGC
jgi:hypothetical protein